MSAVEVGRALEKLVSVLADTEWTDIPEAVQKRAALVTVSYTHLTLPTK